MDRGAMESQLSDYIHYIHGLHSMESQMSQARLSDETTTKTQQARYSNEISAMKVANV